MIIRIVLIIKNFPSPVTAISRLANLSRHISRAGCYSPLDAHAIPHKMYLAKIKSVECQGRILSPPLQPLKTRRNLLQKKKADSVRESAFCWMPKICFPLLLWAEVNSHIESGMIPISLVVPAPLPVRIHLIDIVVHLAAVFTMSARVAINFGSIGF